MGFLVEILSKFVIRKKSTISTIPEPLADKNKVSNFQNLPKKKKKIKRKRVENLGIFLDNTKVKLGKVFGFKVKVKSKRKKGFTFKQVARLQIHTKGVNQGLKRKKRIGFKKTALKFKTLGGAKFNLKEKKIEEKKKFKFKSVAVLGKMLSQKISAKIKPEITQTQTQDPAENQLNNCKIELGDQKTFDGQSGSNDLKNQNLEELVENYDLIKEMEFDENKRNSIEELEDSLKIIMDRAKNNQKMKSVIKLYGFWRKEVVQRKLQRKEKNAVKMQSIMHDLKTLEELLFELRKIEKRAQRNIHDLHVKLKEISNKSEIPKFPKEYIKSMRYNPPNSIQILLKAICILRGIEPLYYVNGATKKLLGINYLPPSKKLLGGNFISQLNKLRNPENISKDNLIAYRDDILTDPNFNRESIDKAFPPFTALYDWIKIFEKFAIIVLDIRDKENIILLTRKMEEKARGSVDKLKMSLSYYKNLK